MISYSCRQIQTCSAGARWTALAVPHAPGQGLWITSSAAAQRFSETGAIVGDTTRCLRRWLRQSVRPSPVYTTRDLRSRSSILSRLERSPKYTRGHPQASWEEPVTGDLLVDLEKQLKFPAVIFTTTLRPDIAILSTSSRQAAILELTGSWEAWAEEATEKKGAKQRSACRRGWKTWCLPFGVGCRGFAG